MHAFTTKYNGLARVLITDVGLSTPYNPTNGIKEPEITIKAIWDTGASMSVITKKTASQLKLQPSGKVLAKNTSEEKLHDSYILNVYLPNKLMIVFVKVIDCEDILDNADMLIGMDIIGMGDLAITNKDGKTVMSYVIPSAGAIDYVEKVNQINAQSPVIRRIEEKRRRREINASKLHKKKKRK